MLTESQAQAIDAVESEVQLHIVLGSSELTPFYQSVLASLEDLRNEDWKDEEILPFVVYKSVEGDFDSAPEFLEAFAKDIGFASGIVMDISTDLINALSKE